MNLPAAIALGGLSVSTGLHAAASLALLRLRKTGRGQVLPHFAPPVSILKPLFGLDDGLEENLESFFRLDYGCYEVVFSFVADTDPAYPIARRVADRHPGIPSTFVFDGRDGGGNAKIDRLAAALEKARHRMILTSDGNVRVRPDFLSRAVSHFAQSRVGLVSHLFLATGAVSLASKVESLYLNGCLQPGTAALSGILRIPCVVGKSILVSRAALNAIGGFPVLQNFLAEDFLIGRQVRRAGYGIVLSADLIDTAEIRKTPKAAFARHRRWAIMRGKLVGPLYLFEMFSGPLPWALAAAAAGAWVPAGLLLALRYAVEGALAARLGRRLSVSDWLLLPVRDLFAAAVFLAGLSGRTLSWRGRPLRIGKDTRILRPVDAATGPERP
jgi:ceramide glucosyltransferase